MKTDLTYKNKKYLEWIKSERCIISGKKAEVVHHVRYRDCSSGIGKRPSDYRVLPLLNFYHTFGQNAVHRIGPESFYKIFKIDSDQVIIDQMLRYLLVVYNIKKDLSESMEKKESIKELEKTIQSLRSEKSILTEIENEKLRKRKLKEKNKEYFNALKSNEDFRKKEEAIRRERNAKMREMAKENRLKIKKQMEENEQQIEYKEKMKADARERRKMTYQKMKKFKKELLNKSSV